MTALRCLKTLELPAEMLLLWVDLDTPLCQFDRLLPVAMLEVDLGQGVEVRGLFRGQPNGSFGVLKRLVGPAATPSRQPCQVVVVAGGVGEILAHPPVDCEHLVEQLIRLATLSGLFEFGHEVQRELGFARQDRMAEADFCDRLVGSTGREQTRARTLWMRCAISR